ncbi:MAG TPA: GxxExxY protein [Longimicrobiales bacterium]|nr:GxxExxY protein [Longimicrobiales bacterium]
MNINRITASVIGAAIEVHRTLGPGLLESTYETCFAYELLCRRIPYERQKAIPIRYRGIAVESAYRVDFLVGGKVIVELKSVERLDRVHTAQVLTYLKLSGCRVGLLINFNVPLLKDGIRRLIL